MPTSRTKIGFIPADLEEELFYIAKWGGTNIKGIIGILSAMIDTGLSDNDLVTPKTKTGAQFLKQKDLLTKKLWSEIEPNYNGSLEGNQYYSIIGYLIGGQTSRGTNILKKFKPYRKFQK